MSVWRNHEKTSTTHRLCTAQLCGLFVHTQVPTGNSYTATWLLQLPSQQSTVVSVQATLRDKDTPHSPLLWDTSATIKYWWASAPTKKFPVSWGGGWDGYPFPRHVFLLEHKIEAYRNELGNETRIYTMKGLPSAVKRSCLCIYNVLQQFCFKSGHVLAVGFVPQLVELFCL